MALELRIDRVAAGGDGIATAPDGRVVFVPGAMPGDTVMAEVVAEKKQWIRAVSREVVEASPDRVVPPCEAVARGCGGCNWQHVDPRRQHELRVDIVRDAIRRIGRLEPIEIRPGPPLDPTAYRTSVRAVVTDGRAGFRSRASHDSVVPQRCEIAHPGVRELMAESDFGRADEVVIRVSEATGERLVHFETDPGDGVQLPSDVIISTRAEPAHLTEIVSGVAYRVSGPSFFQCRPDGAAAMVEIVREILDDTRGPLVDAYAGVGLFGAALGGVRPLTSIEGSASSVEDSRHNLPAGATIVEEAVERWKATPAEVVIADPSRKGLGREGVATLAATGARRFALVSCDPAAMARDLRLLTDTGYEAEHITVLDLFGHTSHVEAITSLRRVSDHTV